jgi:hypothetical protein
MKKLFHVKHDQDFYGKEKISMILQFYEASEAIFNAKKEIELKGFPVPEEEE